MENMTIKLHDLSNKRNEEEKPWEEAMVANQVTRDLARRDEEEKRN